MVVKYQDITNVIDDEKGYTKDYIVEHACEIVEVINSVAASLSTLPLGVKVCYNENSITQVLIDAVEDLKRIHEFHPINNANSIKEAAYIGYWWQRRKPVYIDGDITKVSVDGLDDEQIKKIKAKLLFINEVCVAHYVQPKIFALAEGPIKQCASPKNQSDWVKAREHFIYFLAYRAGGPKSVEAVLSNETLHPIWKTKQDFWNVIDGQ